MPEAQIAIQICELTKAHGTWMVPRDVTAGVFKGEVIALTARERQRMYDSRRRPPGGRIGGTKAIITPSARASRPVVRCQGSRLNNRQEAPMGDRLLCLLGPPGERHSPPTFSGIQMIERANFLT